MDNASRSPILIVDDLPEKLLVYRSILEELGEELVTVRSGSEALKQVLKQDFAVILLDVNMPEIDGFETAQLIRQRKRSAHTPIIFLTAFTDEVRTAQGYATGGVDYLATPVVPDVLRAKVRVFIDLFKLRRQVAEQAEEQARRAAAEETARRAAFLSEASRALTGSLDVATTMRALLAVVVPRLADLGAVTLVEYGDEKWQSEIGYLDDANQLTYLTLQEHDAPHDVLRESHDRVLTSGSYEILDQLEIPAIGSERIIRWAAVLPLVARGRILGALTLARDKVHAALSDDDLALAEDLAGRAAIAIDNALLVHSIQENDRRRNEFLAMLAHELRNPLAPIRSAVEILGTDPELHPESQPLVSVIDRQLSHLVRIVDDLLDVSRITRGKIQLRPQIVNLTDALHAAIETSCPLITTHRHQLSVELPVEPLWVRGDAARLAQVFANLLNNACKYTADGGHISLAANRQNTEIVVRVCDSGSGIPRKLQSKIFDMFTQADQSLARSQGGLGIGLTVVKRLVEMHGGSVQVTSTGPDKGSEFVIRLPCCVDEAVDSRTILDPLPITAEMSQRLKILIVDDNQDAATMLSMLLRSGRHEVRIVHDGLAALDEAKRFEPDAMLLDIGLPGIDGYEVARRVRQMPGFSQLLLVAISGYGQEEDRQRSMAVGIDFHLIKPVDLANLRIILDEQVARLYAESITNKNFVTSAMS